MSETKTIHERLSAATVSGDLSQCAERIADVDYLTAAGVAGSRHGLGSAVLRLDLTQDRSDLGPAILATIKLVSEIAAKRGWPMHAQKRKRIAYAVLLHHLSPACPECKGRGMVGMDRDRPGEYKPRVCNSCGGSGKRPIQRKHQREIREVLHVLDRRRDVIEGTIRKLMRSA